jgi:hypothetical protein
MEYKGHKLRHEYKFYINTFVYHELRERFRHALYADPNMKDEKGYLISSLYYDDMYNSAMDDKINGTPLREKYRIRLYNHSDEAIKLECKRKFNQYITKQVAGISKEEYYRLLRGDYDFLPTRSEEVCKALYVNCKTKLLRPVTVVEYLREAYVHPNGNVRITFDKNLSAGIGDLDIFHRDCETIQVPMDGMMIIEVKYDDFIPDYIWRLIQTDRLVKCAISKYVMCRDINRKVRIV